MLCQRCRTGILSRFPLHYRTSVSLPSSRYVNRIPAATHIRLYSTPLTPSAPVPNGHPLSTSDISFASTTSATSGPDSPSLTKPPGAERIASTAPVGTRLSGLSYVKNKRDPVAMDDSEYPDWLWGLLDSKSAGKVDGGGDTSGMNKKQRKRHEKKLASLAASRPRKIPLHEQSIDITPAGSGTPGGSTVDLQVAAASLETRAKITKSAREARRKGIREANFLRGL